MEIKRAVAGDLAEILALQKLCYQENAARYNDFSMQPLTQTVKEIEGEFKRGVMLKAVEGGKIIGSVRAYESKGACHIGKVIVHPDRQNLGIGAKLMAEIEASFPNVSRYELFTGHKDEKNIYFYGKLGYKTVKTGVEMFGVKMIFLEKKAKAE
jgi:ribosomal protein S18 acetylase RimI-like enzyme